MLFEEALIVTLPQRKKRRLRPYLVGTVIGYSLIVTALIIASIFSVHPELNESLASSVLLSAPPPPPPPPPPASSQPASQVTRRPTIMASFVPPTSAPRHVPDAGDLPAVDSAPASGVLGGVAGGVPGGVIGGTVGGIVGGVLGATATVAAVPPAPEPPPAPAAAKPQPVSTGVLLGNAVRQAQAFYPLLAQKIQIQGVVQVRIIVDEQGNVIAVEALNGHPLLQPSALEAARQWKFRPTLLNGHPIKVAGILSFTFRLT